MPRTKGYELIKKVNGYGIRFYIEINGKKERPYLYEKGWAPEDAMAAMVAYREKAGFIDNKDITLASYLNRFFDDYIEQNVGESTQKRYDEFVKLHIAPAIGNIELQKLKPTELQSFYTRLSRKVVRGRRLSPTTVLKVHRFLHEAFRYAILWGYLRYNPCDGVKPPAQAKAEMMIPTDDEMKAILEKAEETSMALYMAVYIASTTGMRLGEILGLQLPAVDLDARKYFVRYSWNSIKDRKTKRYRWVLKKTKTKSSRRPVPFLPGTEAVLKRYCAYKADYQAERRAKGRKYNDRSEFFLVNRFGDPLNPEGTSRRFKKIIRELGLSEQMRFHDLRHYHASWLLRQGVHPKVVQERLGHSSIKITLDTYSHLIPDMQAKVMASLDSSVFESGHVLGTKTAVYSGTKVRIVRWKRGAGRGKV